MLNANFHGIIVLIVDEVHAKTRADADVETYLWFVYRYLSCGHKQFVLAITVTYLTQAVPC